MAKWKSNKADKIAEEAKIKERENKIKNMNDSDIDKFISDHFGDMTFDQREGLEIIVQAIWGGTNAKGKKWHRQTD